MTIPELLTKLQEKPSWGRTEIATFLNQIPETQVAISNLKKIRYTEVIKKYDILYMQTMQGAHYVLCHKVKDNIVYGLVLTSKQECHNLMEIKEDRFFNGNFITKAYLCWDIETARKNFVRVYESRKEADQAFKQVKSFYKTILSI